MQGCSDNPDLDCDTNSKDVWIPILVSDKYPTVECQENTVSVLGRDEGYTVKYNPLPQGVPGEGKAQGNSVYPDLSPNMDIISFEQSLGKYLHH